MSIARYVPLVTAAFALALSLTTARAGTLPDPTGDVILTVSGNITDMNGDGVARFDRQMLEDMGLVDITTSTPWYDGRSTFSGVPLGTLLDRVGAQGETMTAIALNDYESEIPTSDAADTGVILAIKLNGQDMTVRDKGPVFVIYPYDSSPQYQTQSYYARSAWQVTRLIIR